MLGAPGNRWLQTFVSFISFVDLKDLSETLPLLRTWPESARRGDASCGCPVKADGEAGPPRGRCHLVG